MYNIIKLNFANFSRNIILFTTRPYYTEYCDFNIHLRSFIDCCSTPGYFFVKSLATRFIRKAGDLSKKKTKEISEKFWYTFETSNELTFIQRYEDPWFSTNLFWLHGYLFRRDFRGMLCHKTSSRRNLVAVVLNNIYTLNSITTFKGATVFRVTVRVICFLQLKLRFCNKYVTPLSYCTTILFLILQNFKI